MEYKEVYESWLANPYFDEATKQELLSINDRYCRDWRAMC